MSPLPIARTPDPSLAPPLRWGVIAPGRIAAGFTEALHAHTRHRVVAVGSRSAERAQAFARRFGIDRAHPSYRALVNDPEVDAVYVASPHSEHHAQALLAIAAGKPVLVEKAFTRNAAEAREVVQAAADAGLLVMEAMWTRFLPQTDVLGQLLADGVLGEVTTVLADHGQYFDPDPADRLFAPELAGGALLDLGVYPLSLASFVLGVPGSRSATGGGPDVVAVGTLTDTGVDAQVSMVLTAGSAQACLSTTLLAATPTTASIAGTVGRVDFGGPFYAPTEMTLWPTGSDEPVVRPADHLPGSGGMAFEAAHFATLLAEGATESPLLPPAESVAVLDLIDGIRDRLGVVYPGE